MTATLPATEARIVADDQVLDTPCVVVDEQILQNNIAEMASYAASLGVNLRPHMKTHKTPQIARLQIAAGAIGATCAKLGEAEVMVDQGGITDVLLAYQIVGEPKIARLLALMERAHVTVTLDSRKAGEALSRAMSQAERTLDIYVEVNTGQNRAGALAGADAVALAIDLARHPGLHVVGVMTHEGHAGSSAPDAIAETALAAGRALVETANAIRAEGVEIAHVSVGSTPSISYTPTVPGITEMRPGTYVFNDNSAFRHGRIGPDRCAARIATSVISRSAPDRAVIDAGSKALAFDPSPSHPGHGYLVGHATAIIERVTEEHGSVKLPADEPGFAIGDTHEVIANHVCPTINLTDELFIVRGGKVLDTWAVAARGKVR